jgi:hypothetical protein
MATDSKIGWTDHTANLWWGCVEVSPLCDNCYAREWAARYDRAKWGAKEPRLAIKGVWADLAKWQRGRGGKGDRLPRVLRVDDGHLREADACGEREGGGHANHDRLHPPLFLQRRRPRSRPTCFSCC